MVQQLEQDPRLKPHQKTNARGAGRKQEPEAPAARGAVCALGTRLARTIAERRRRLRLRLPPAFVSNLRSRIPTAIQELVEKHWSTGLPVNLP